MVFIEIKSIEEDFLLFFILYLSHFFDFGASFANEGAALAGRDNEPQGYRGFAGGWTVAHRVDYILRGGKTRFYQINAAVTVCAEVAL